MLSLCENACMNVDAMNILPFVIEFPAANSMCHFLHEKVDPLYKCNSSSAGPQCPQSSLLGFCQGETHNLFKELSFVFMLSFF